MYDPPGNFGYNDGVTLREASRADAAVQKRNEDRESSKKE